MKHIAQTGWRISRPVSIMAFLGDSDIDWPALALAGAMLLMAMLGLSALGHRYGKRILAGNPDAATGTGAVEAAVFSLLGLLIAFTFSGAFLRLDARRQLVVEEVNAIGTAFLRLDLIDDPTERQLLQKLLKEYVNSRIRLWAKMSHRSAALAEVTVACALQREIWSVAITATERPELESERLLVLPALNETFDLA
ncbi:MAG: hypothetical protein KDA63_09025, partial [Planctomycetales bacterium]|nr:hypothetical protein [Planctomycetales bacterium]